MEVEAYLNGILPRSELALNLGSAWLKGRETLESYHNLLEKETKEFIELQKNLGLNYIFDGQLLWDDFLRPIASALQLHTEGSNANENAVTRQIYTNTFYRKPLILKKLEKANKPLNEDRFLDLIPEGKRKVILPSPFALAYLSSGIHKNEDGTIKNDAFIGVLFDIAKVLNNEIKRLEREKSASFVQFNEPCMCYAEETKGFFHNIAKSLQIATEKVDVITSLHLYNGDASKFLPDIIKCPVGRIGVDAYSTDLSKFSSAKFDKFLELGVVNSKNSLIEEPETLAKYAKQAMEKINPQGLALVPNRPLELVPQEIAKKKIESLAKARDLLRG